MRRCMRDENNISFVIQTQSGQHKGVNIGIDNNVELNKWYHLIGRYDGQNVGIYLDGKLIEQKSASGNLKQNSFPFLVKKKIVPERVFHKEKEFCDCSFPFPCEKIPFLPFLVKKKSFRNEFFTRKRNFETVPFLSFSL